MGIENPSLLNNVHSESGEFTPERTLIIMLGLSGLGLLSLTTWNTCDIHNLEDRLDSLATPTPAPEVGIHTFENTFTSDLQVVFPE